MEERGKEEEQAKKEGRRWFEKSILRRKRGKGIGVSEREMGWCKRSSSEATKNEE